MEIVCNGHRVLMGLAINMYSLPQGCLEGGSSPGRGGGGAAIASG